MHFNLENMANSYGKSKNAKRKPCMSILETVFDNESAAILNLRSN